MSRRITLHDIDFGGKTIPKRDVRARRPRLGQPRPRQVGADRGRPRHPPRRAPPSTCRSAAGRTTASVRRSPASRRRWRSGRSSVASRTPVWSASRCGTGGSTCGASSGWTSPSTERAAWASRPPDTREHGGMVSIGRHKHVVETTAGKVSGKAGSKGRLVHHLGVPYAAPPIGSLRWKAPAPPEPWRGSRQVHEGRAARLSAGRRDGRLLRPARRWSRDRPGAGEGARRRAEAGEQEAERGLPHVERRTRPPVRPGCR